MSDGERGDDIETFDDNQYECPYCGEQYDISHHADELVCSDGSHRCDGLIGYCEQCESEWIEPAEESDPT